MWEGGPGDWTQGKSALKKLIQIKPTCAQLITPIRSAHKTLEHPLCSDLARCWVSTSPLPLFTQWTLSLATPVRQIIGEKDLPFFERMMEKERGWGGGGGGGGPLGGQSIILSILDCGTAKTGNVVLLFCWNMYQSAAAGYKRTMCLLYRVHALSMEEALSLTEINLRSW